MFVCFPTLSDRCRNVVIFLELLSYEHPSKGGPFLFIQPESFIFSDCPDQCAALYLVRILTAARCAGFRQAKSPGRVRSFRWKHCWSCFTTSLIRLRSTNRGLTRARSIGRAFIPWMTRIWLLPGVRWRSCKPGLTSPLSWNASRWTASIRQRNITRSIPNGYCHVSLGMIQKAKAWKPGDPTTL